MLQVRHVGLFSARSRAKSTIRRPDVLREHYKPLYRRVIDACHQYGMHFIWHDCGCMVDMFADMIDLGVDVVQLDQTRLMGHEALIEQWA